MRRADDHAGLAMLLNDAPKHDDATLWRRSCEAYANYLKDISLPFHRMAFYPEPYTKWTMLNSPAFTTKAKE